MHRPGFGLQPLAVAPVPPVDHVEPNPITRESAAWRAQQIWRQEAAAKLRKARGGPVETERNRHCAHPSREALTERVRITLCADLLRVGRASMTIRVEARRRLTDEANRDTNRDRNAGASPK
jgi:hypothetical protein